MPKFQVIRNCCTSGNCFDCRDVTPFGKPLRVVQSEHDLEERANQVAAGWERYKAEVQPGKEVFP